MRDFHKERQARLRATLLAAGVDVALVPPSGDLVYLTGLEMHLSERLSLLVLPVQGEPVMVLPEFEASRVPRGLKTSTWREEQDPLPILLNSLSEEANVIAFGERVAASELLGVIGARPDARAVALERVTGGVRAVKTDAEIAALKDAAAATDRAFSALLSSPMEGMSERELAARLASLLKREGLTDVFATCASGPNAAYPHHVPGERLVERGDGVMFDFGGRSGGYLSDVTRTVAVKEAPARLKEVHAAVAAAQLAALEVLRPGVPYGEVDGAARASLAAVGLAEYFSHRLGHGLGLEIHEPPYLTGDNEQVAAAGHVVTVEPGVYVPGELGVRIEDDVVITDSGHEVLTRAPRELLIVD